MLNDEKLQTWKARDYAAAELRDLRAFARYRIALTYARAGDRDAVEAAVEHSQREDAGHPYAQLSAILGRAYASTASIGAACQAVLEYARGHPELIEPLNGYGYANPDFTVADLCPF